GIRAFHVTGVQTCALPIWPNVRVNAISPGYIDTAIWQAQLDAMEPAAAAARAEEVRARHPVGRRGVPDDVSATAAFLCSHDASLDRKSVVQGSTVSSRLRP